MARSVKKSSEPKDTVKAGTSPRAKLEEGSAAPPLRLASSDDRDVCLEDFPGKIVIVYFYPKDDTPGCTREAQAFRDAASELAKRDAVVLGVSKDSIASHCRFRDKYELNFPLLSDPDTSTLSAWGAYGEKNMYGKKSMGVIRTTVIVGPDRKVLKVYPNVKVDGHVEKVLEFIDSL